MRTLVATMGAVRRASAIAVAVVLGIATSAVAQPAGTDKTGGYIVFPKVVVDSAGALIGSPTDTLIQISNTDLINPRPVDCTWVNATSFCGDPVAGCPGATTTACNTSADCPGGLQCIPCWSETDFPMVLTPGQPIAFHAGSGEALPCFGFPLPTGCLDDNQGAISPAPGDPFVGELKCVQTTVFDEPPNAPLAARNDLVGEATIISTDPDPLAGPTTLRTASYDAYAFPTSAAADGTDGGAPLCLGGFSAAGAPTPLANPCGDADCGLTYAGCPAVLILNHFFEGAPNVLGDGPGTFVRTNLTLVPCSEAVFSGNDINQQAITTAQFLIYNEFEQRYSASTRVQCFKDIPLADIDSRPGSSDDAFSIFSVGVQGTMTGQTRIRGVAGQEDNLGHGLIGIAQEFYLNGGLEVESAAYELHGDGDRQQGDAVCRLEGFFPPPVGP